MKDNNSFPFEVTDLQKFVHKKGNNNAVCAHFSEDFLSVNNIFQI